MQTSALLELSRCWAPDGNDFNKAETIGVTIMFTSEYASRLGQFDRVQKHLHCIFQQAQNFKAVICTHWKSPCVLSVLWPQSVLA